MFRKTVAFASARPEDWHDRGACRNRDPEWWYAPVNSGMHDRARTICLYDCPVRQQCLESSLDRKEQWGMWGGVDEEQRRRILHKKPTAAPRSRARTEPGQTDRCANGHLWTEETTYLRPRGGGKECRVCVRAYKHKATAGAR